MKLNETVTSSRRMSWTSKRTRVCNSKRKRVEVTGDSQARLAGDSTIRDVTKQVAIDVEYAGKAKNPEGTTRGGSSGDTKINRKDWGLTWNQALDTGRVLVGDTIDYHRA